VLSWQAVTFCGFQPPLSLSSEQEESGTGTGTCAGTGIRYEIELCEAHAYKAGVSSHFASDAASPASDFHVVCSSHKQGSIGIVDLSPGTWHFARLAVVYSGCRFYSPSLPFYTQFASPPQPARPRLVVAAEMSAADPEQERTQVRVYVCAYVCVCVCVCVYYIYICMCLSSE